MTKIMGLILGVMGLVCAISFFVIGSEGRAEPVSQGDLLLITIGICNITGLALVFGRDRRG